MKVRKIRLLRMKYGITREELGNASGISAQRISQIELCQKHITEETELKLKVGLEKVIREKENTCKELANDYAWHKDTLFELVWENNYEL